MSAINFLVCGVGGQGTVVASDILSSVGLTAGYQVKKSDVLGLAQRGGSVISHIRWDTEPVHAPMVSLGEIDYMVAFERLEALRRLPYMKQEGTVVVSAQEIHPISVTTGQIAYPKHEELLQSLQRNVRRVFEIEALQTALRIGNPKIVNIVLLGALSSLFPIESIIWEETVIEFVPSHHQEINLNAFRAGRRLIKEGSAL